MLEYQLTGLIWGVNRVHVQLKSTQNPIFTATGCGALLIWAMYAFLVSEVLGNLPVYETIFLMFSFNFVVMAIRFTYKKQWNMLKQPLIVWLIGVLGVCGSDFTYVMAMKYAPPAHVDFIDYLWPFMVIVFSGFLPQERFTIRHIVGGALALVGVCMLLTSGEGLQWDYMPGYIYAFIAASIWCLYTLFSRWYQKMPAEMVGIYYGVGALFALVLHQQQEVFVMPNVYEMFLILGLGLSSGLAALLWVLSTQKGNVKLLGVLAYFTPLLSMLLLVYCEKEPMSTGLIMASVLFMCGVLVGCIDWKRIRRSSSSSSMPLTQN